MVEIVEICGGDSEYDSMVADDGGWGWRSYYRAVHERKESIRFGL